MFQNATPRPIIMHIVSFSFGSPGVSGPLTQFTWHNNSCSRMYLPSLYFSVDS